jgi:hypothetical protein
MTILVLGGLSVYLGVLRLFGLLQIIASSGEARDNR